MSGLLDHFPEFLKSPEGQGLLSTVFGGLAGARRNAPLNSIGQAGMAGLMGYGNALERQENLDYKNLQMEALKQATAANRRKEAIIAGMMGGDQAAAPAAPVGVANPGIPAANVQSPVFTDAENSRRAALPVPEVPAPAATPGRTGGILSSLTPDKLAALKMGAGVDLVDVWKLSKPDMQVANGYAYDKNNIKPGFMPGITTSQDGKSTVTTIGPDGIPRVSAPNGALDTYAAYRRAEAGIQSANELVKVLDPTTKQEVMVPKSNLLNSNPGQLPQSNNFGNIRPNGQSTGFQSFATPEQGLAAIDANLQAYGKKGINTLSGIISRWSPQSENNTGALVESASKRLGIPKDATLDLSNPAVRQLVGSAIMLQEHGPNAFISGGQGNTRSAPNATSLPLKTEGQKAVDDAFGKEYANWVGQGGYTDVQKQLNQLRTASNNLKNDPSLTGPLVGMFPDSVRSFTNPEAVNTRNLVEESVQRNLRAVLGAQFTENEGTRLIARAFNPQLSTAENQRRVDRLITQIGNAAQQKADAAAYFEKNGTLAGWEGKLPSFADFNPESKDSSNKSNPDSSSASQNSSGNGSNKLPVPMKGMIRNGYKFKGGDPAVQSNWEKM